MGEFAVTGDNLTAIKETIRKYCLANAVKYDGKAETNAVIGKLFAERPEFRSQARIIVDLVNAMVKQINALSPEEQLTQLQALAPELVEQQRERRLKELPPLPEAKMGKVITRLPPEPSGYPHIGHAYAGFINWYYARKYHGRLILRFEDTNPRLVQQDFYDAFRDGYQWMGISWDQELMVSDDLPIFYKHARELLERGQAYMCTCPDNLIKKHRRTGTPCHHRNAASENNLAIWDDILDGKYHEGEIVCRLKIDLTHPNAVMRDPNIFRIIEYPHPLQEERYRLWPTYDFAVALEDHHNGITHILRSNEFASRGELQAYIRDLFNLPQPRIQEFSRFTIQGTPVSKRKIRTLIETNIISGWDDIRLTTLPSLRRRGIVPETIKEVTREIGLSIAQPVIDWSLILGINRRILDPLANRYYCVTNPVAVTITGAQPKDAVIPFHPDNPERGTRIIHAESRVYIDGADAEHLQEEDIFRLKHLYNVRVRRKTRRELVCTYEGDDVNAANLKIQWLTEETVPVYLQIPDILLIDEQINPHSLRIEEGIGETTLRTLEPATIIQLERKGFGRVDSTGDQVTINMTG